jgi:hypothetical protein
MVPDDPRGERVVSLDRDVVDAVFPADGQCGADSLLELLGRLVGERQPEDLRSPGSRSATRCVRPSPRSCPNRPPRSSTRDRVRRRSRPTALRSARSP